MSSWSCVFQVGTLAGDLYESSYVFASRSFSVPLNFSFSCYLSIQIFCLVLSVPTSCSKLFCFLCIRFFTWPCAFSVDLEFFSVFRKVLFCMYCLALSPISVEPPFFRKKNFWSISSNCIVSLVCCSLIFVFLFHCALVELSLLYSSSCCHSSFIYSLWVFQGQF